MLCLRAFGLLLLAGFLVAFCEVTISLLCQRPLEFLEVGQGVINLHNNIKIFILTQIAE